MDDDRGPEDDGWAELARQLLETEDLHSIRLLAEGEDHLALEVNDTFIVRRRKQPGANAAACVDREARLLGLVARVSPIPVPEVVTAHPPLGIIVVRKLPGTSLLDEPPGEPLALVEPLARFLSSIYDIPVDLVESIAGTDPYGLTAFLADAAAGMPVMASVLSRDDRRLVEAFLGSAPPSEPTIARLCHNDFGAEHLLAAPDRTTLTGVIDWSDAAVTDPARDLGRLYRDFGPAVAAAIHDRLDLPGDDRVLERAAFLARCVLLEDLAFGLGEGQHRYAERALAHLRRTFAS